METTATQPTQPAIANELDPKNFNYKLWDNQAWGLTQVLWQIESIVGLAVRAVDHDSPLGDELHGSLKAVETLCKQSQEILEVHLMRPVDEHFKAD